MPRVTASGGGGGGDVCEEPHCVEQANRRP